MLIIRMTWNSLFWMLVAISMVEIATACLVDGANQCVVCSYDKYSNIPYEGGGQALVPTSCIAKRNSNSVSLFAYVGPGICSTGCDGSAAKPYPSLMNALVVLGKLINEAVSYTHLTLPTIYSV
eukprot:TRINITY_DN17403_c0_g1_i2.p1 TRINITY_DN17403_c0_g1~~TRINITY_DN17403_c0_g1_i2.p1  ORF type:complete len:124 (+),score=6.72 TRINITY_DN17403_c0_g1_i2:180-551(+)